MTWKRNIEKVFEGYDLIYINKKYNNDIVYIIICR